MTFFPRKTLRVWHPESPGLKVYVYRSWWQEWIHPRCFAGLTEHFDWTCWISDVEDRTLKCNNDHDEGYFSGRHARDAMRRDEEAAEAKLRELNPPQYWGSHLPECPPEDQAPCR